MLFSLPTKHQDSGLLEFNVYLGSSKPGKWRIEVFLDEVVNCYYDLEFPNFSIYYPIYVDPACKFWRAVNDSGNALENGFLPTASKEKRELRIFLPPEHNDNQEHNLLILPGLSKFKNIKFVSSGDTADLIIHTWSGMEPQDKDFVERWKHKTILADFGDICFVQFFSEYPLCFKRSWSWGNNIRFDYSHFPNVRHLSYCVKEVDGKTGFDLHQPENKEIDVICHFNPNPKGDKRERIANHILSLGERGYNVKVGMTSDYQWPKVYSTIHGEYFSQMSESKIIVTCNPNYWEGDYRLYEAVTSGGLVFCDKMWRPPSELVDVIEWYDPEDPEDLLARIEKFLFDPELLKTRSDEIRKRAMKESMPMNLAARILRESCHIFPEVDIDWVLETK